MEISVIPKHRMVLVRVSGEIDHHSAEFIRKSLEREIRKTSAINIAMDFSRVTFMDSSGIGMIIGRYKTVRALGGNLIVFDAGESIKRIFEMAGLSSLIIITDTLQRGISRMQKNGGVKI